MELKLNTIVRFLNKELKINKIKDSSRNGLQVRGKDRIKKIGFAVDGCLLTFKKAKKAKIDLLIVHHGIKWTPQKRSELNKKREMFLKRNKISLYGVHLPLDTHNKQGNNIGLCNILGLKNIKKFGIYGSSKIGYSGKFEKAVTLPIIANILDKKLKTKSKIYPFGKKTIKTIGVVSGGGADAIQEAVKEKLDCFLTGEMNLGHYNWAKDSKLNMIVAGHYATETVGVKLLRPLIKNKFDIQTVWIENKVDL